MKKIKACTTQLHYISLNTWKLLHPQMAFPPWLLCCRCTGRYRLTVLNSRICQHCSMWSFTNFRTACNKPGNENRPIAIFSGTKHLPYGTGGEKFQDPWQLCKLGVTSTRKGIGITISLPSSVNHLILVRLQSQLTPPGQMRIVLQTRARWSV